MCFNCLRSSHIVKLCNSKSLSRDGDCKQRHHSLLCEWKSGEETKKQVQTSETQPQLLSEAVINSMVVQVLSTAVIHVRTNVADLLQVRTVIDSGSGASFVSEGCVQKLGLPRSNGKVVVFRVENKRLDVTTRGLVKLEIINQFNETTVL